MRDALEDVLPGHREGQGGGITSVRSANPLVIQAVYEQSNVSDAAALIEATSNQVETSNQVDQFDGYTGMRPAEFRDLVHDIAEGASRSRGRVVLGGDHPSPIGWRSLPAEEAMSRAEDVVWEYLEASFTKERTWAAASPVTITDYPCPPRWLRSVPPVWLTRLNTRRRATSRLSPRTARRS